MIEEFSGVLSVDPSPAMRRLLEDVAVLQSRASATLERNGRRSEAERAGQFAVRARLTLDEPKAIRRMRSLVRTVNESANMGVLLERALDGAISLIGSDYANVQLRDATTGSLWIAAQYGFGSEFLEYFAIVDDDSSACGRAASQRSQTVIVDVAKDPAFAPHREIALASNFRAVQSTPLLDSTGRMHGVVSTHFRRSHRPSSRDLELIKWYTEHVGAAIARRERNPASLYETTAAQLAQTADLQDDVIARMNGSARAQSTNGNHAQAQLTRAWAQSARNRAREARQRAEELVARARNL